jgi:hypothetical protein
MSRRCASQIPVAAPAEEEPVAVDEPPPPDPEPWAAADSSLEELPEAAAAAAAGAHSSSLHLRPHLPHVSAPSVKSGLGVVAAWGWCMPWARRMLLTSSVMTGCRTIKFCTRTHSNLLRLPALTAL